MTDILLLPKGFFRRITDKALTLLYPARCPVCDRPVWPASEKICFSCLRSIRPITDGFCEKCGKKSSSGTGICSDCRRRDHAFSRCRGGFEYGTLSSAIYRFKYLGRREYADVFAKMTLSQLADYIYGVRPDVIVAVPVSKNKLLKRGYNQAEDLARALSKLSGIPFCGDALRRTLDTAPMKLLTPEERQKNLKNAFKTGQNVVKSKRVLLVDDIYTTGATMDTCSVCLLEAGAESVYGLTIASGTGV